MSFAKAISNFFKKKPTVADHDFWLKFKPSQDGYSRDEARSVHFEMLDLQANLFGAEQQLRHQEARYRHHQIDENQMAAAEYNAELIEDRLNAITRLADHFGGYEWQQVKAEHQKKEREFYSTPRNWSMAIPSI